MDDFLAQIPISRVERQMHCVPTAGVGVVISGRRKELGEKAVEDIRATAGEASSSNWSSFCACLVAGS